MTLMEARNTVRHIEEACPEVSEDLGTGSDPGRRGGFIGRSGEVSGTGRTKKDGHGARETPWVDPC
jgi:hypothetical protein